MLGNHLHRIHRSNWLRAGVLGANDGILSIASLMVGLSAARAEPRTIWVAGLASLVAGAMSMAAGEYVSVSSQADTEQADLRLEARQIAIHRDEEEAELAEIYRGRGLDAALAQQVASQLMAHDALGAHARDELGITPSFQARPLQAALASALAFAGGAALPLALTLLAPPVHLTLVVSVSALVFLALLGAIGAYTGGAPLLRPALRITLWGALAMGFTALIGALVGTPL